MNKHDTECLQDHINGEITPIPLAVSFLEWISSEGYMRLSKNSGHEWFKPEQSEAYTTTKLYELFIVDVQDEHTSINQKERLKKMIIGKLCEEYTLEDATDQVNNAEIIIKDEIVTVIYDNGKSDRLKMVMVEQLEWVR